MNKFWGNKLLLALFLSVNVISLGQIWPNRNITVEDGLPSNRVHDALTSQSGVVWAATENGIAEIKGRKITTYTESDGLPHNNCWQVVEDDNQTIWVGTYGGGIAYLQNNRFVPITKANGLTDNSVRKFYYTNNKLYVGTQNGLSVVNTLTKSIKNYLLPDSRLQVMDFLAYQDNIYAVGYQHGTYLIGKEILTKVNTEENIFCAKIIRDTLYYSKDGNQKNRNSIYKIRIEDFLENNPSAISFGNSVFWDFQLANEELLGAAWGVNLMNGGVFELSRQQTKRMNEVYGVTSKAIYNLDFSPSINQLMVCTLDKGLFLVDKSKTVTTFPLKSLMYYISPSPMLEVFGYSDRIEIIQDGQFSFCFKEDFLSFASSQITSSALIQKIASNKLLRNFSIENIKQFQDFSILDIKELRGEIYVNTSIGIFVFSSKNENYRLNKYLPLSTTSGYYLNKENEFYFQSPYSSVKKLSFSEDNGGVESFDLTKKDNPRDLFEFIEIDSILFGISRFKGIFRIQADTFESLLSNQIIQVREFVECYKNSENSILLADYLGNVYELTSINNQLSFDTLIESQLIHGQSVVGLSQLDSTILIGTNKGLNLFDKSNAKVMFLDEEQGFEGKKLRELHLKERKLILVGENSYSLFDLEEYAKNQTNSLLFVSNCWINGEKRELPDNGPMILNHKENELVFELGSKAIKFPKKVYYTYRLLGLDNTDWSEKVCYYESNIIRLPYIPPGNYSLEIKFIDEYNGKNEIYVLSHFRIKTPFWQNPLFYLVVSSVIVLFIYLSLKKRFMKKARRQKERADLETKVSEAKLEALKSQMNPHFVFNSLNAIQNFVIENDIDSSLNYMNSFAALIRKSLDYSSRKQLSLNEEIDFLHLFVKIQNLRFGNKVQCKIEKLSKINFNETVIPPMILQPILENCFEHAFTEEVEHPLIEIKFQLTDSFLKVTVRDNGIGFDTRAKESSKGLQLISDRLALLDSRNRLMIDSSHAGTEINVILYN